MGSLLFIIIRVKKVTTKLKSLCKLKSLGTSLVVHWLRLCASIAGGAGLIPVQGTKIRMLHSMTHK